MVDNLSLPGIFMIRYTAKTERTARVLDRSPSLRRERIDPGIIPGSPPLIVIGSSVFRTGLPLTKAWTILVHSLVYWTTKVGPLTFQSFKSLVPNDM